MAAAVEDPAHQLSIIMHRLLSKAYFNSLCIRIGCYRMYRAELETKTKARGYCRSSGGAAVIEPQSLPTDWVISRPALHPQGQLVPTSLAPTGSAGLSSPGTLRVSWRGGVGGGRRSGCSDNHTWSNVSNYHYCFKRRRSVCPRSTSQ